MPTQQVKGITTIIWGTSGSQNKPSGAIIETMRLTPKNGAPIEIEDNNGFAAALVLLDDGFDAAATCLYDANKVWPNIGDNVAILTPSWGSANMGGNVTAFAQYNGVVGAVPEIDMARKREATIAYKVIVRPGISFT